MQILKHLTTEINDGDRYQEHVGCSYGYKVVSEYKEYEMEYKSYRGQNAINKFLESLIKEEKYIRKILEKNAEMILTRDDKRNFKRAVECHICKKKLRKDKVRDHDHITGKYRGAAHSNCNLNYNYKNVKIPVVFHNLRGYDGHLIMQEIGKYAKKLSVIPNTSEKYISFTMDNFVFIDSLLFLTESLDELVECLKKSNDIKLFPNLVNGFKDCSQGQIESLMKKGVYPYDYMNDWRKFEDKVLPPMSEFRSKLNNCDIDKNDYNRAKIVFDIFKCKNMGDYHDLYLKTDVLLLADVFENFRNTCMKNYELDPAHFHTLPALSWCAMLKKTGVRIPLFDNTQLEMLNLFEKHKRGGICMISKRHAVANNPHMKNYDSKQPTKYIIDLDANNLYGWAMSQLLPIDDFQVEITDPNETISQLKDHIMNLDDFGERGYMFVVDLKYPNELHDKHNDYPLAPERMKGEYSPLMKGLAEQHNCKEDESEKLIPNLYDKKNYGVHYRLLKYYLKQGMILEKVHYIISFKQSAWLKPYIDFNTQMRAAAKTEFEVGFFKKFINVIYGKSCENIRDRKDIKLCTTADQAQKLFNKPKYKDHIIFKNDELIAVELAKTKIKYDKPVYLGTCILDLSKLLMYEFHYDFIKPQYEDKCELLFTDTDSLCYEIETADIYEDMLKNKDKFDLSEYPKDHKCYDKTNKKVYGKFKDTTKGAVIVEFVGNRPKLYSFVIEGEDEKLKKLKLERENKRAKGVKKNVIKNELKHENFKNALFGLAKNDQIQNVSFNIIKSANHKLYSVKVEKIGISCLDIKKHILDDNVHTLAHGHYKIKDLKINNINV